MLVYRKKQVSKCKQQNPSMDWSPSDTLSARKHIEEIRTRKFCIGKEELNPLTKDLHHAVDSLSRELYTKDAHFLLELIQNAEDNEYDAGVTPTLEFVLTDKDITGSGCPFTLLVFNNEVGFSKENMDSICSVGLSTKKGKRKRGYIGEKGIGFKSVFLVSKWPHIFSKGYQVRFSEEPNKDCGIGYIVPEWFDMQTSILDIQTLYGSDKVLPNTTFILPLRAEKVDTVKKLLSEMHPEILLFLSKIKRLSARESIIGSCDSDQVSAISIFSETNLSASDANENSRFVLLSIEEEVPEVTEATCSYYIWRKTFPVKPEYSVDERKDVGEFEISIAFPFGERLKRGTSSVGIFAFLPTAMTTNFSFIIQADFILSSSRETILLDNKWNMGILGRVPSAFVNAFCSYTKSKDIGPSSLAQAFTFLPVQVSSVPEFNHMKKSINRLLQREQIIPCALFSDEDSDFSIPSKVIRIFPEFRMLLNKLKEEGIPLDGISSQGKYILHSTLDHEEYNDVLEFLGVLYVGGDYSWYTDCIQASDLLARASVEVYLDLLSFLAHSSKYFTSNSFKTVPLLKYVMRNGKIASSSIDHVMQRKLKIYCIWETTRHGWLSKWNLEFGCPDDMYFFPDSVLKLLVRHETSSTLKNWLSSNGVVVLQSTYKYCCLLSDIFTRKKDLKLVVLLAHLVYHAHLKKFIGADDVSRICCMMPIVDASGHVNVGRTGILVPSGGSKWKKLFGSGDLFMEECGENTSVGDGYVLANRYKKYVEIGNVYAECAYTCPGEFTSERELLVFLVKHTRAMDLLDICPPNVALQVASAELTGDQAFLLLEWIRNLRRKQFKMPAKFIKSIRNGKWMKTYLGFKSPNKCFLWKSKKSLQLSKKDVSRILPVIDKGFYMNEISVYEKELLCIGVRVKMEDAYMFIGRQLISLASSGMNQECLHIFLKLMKCSGIGSNLDEIFLNTLKTGNWMKTNMGYSTPAGSVFLATEFASVSQITCLPIIDQAYYGNWIDEYLDELELLGVVVNLEGVLKLIVENLKLPCDLSTLSGENILFMLLCMKKLGPAAVSLAQKIMVQPMIRTSSGLRYPSETILFHKEWSDFFPVLSVPIIDEAFYGSEICSFSKELKEIGVAVELDMVTEMASLQYKSLALSHELTSVNVISLLQCIKYIRVKEPVLSWKFKSQLEGQMWLETRHGYLCGCDSVLSNPSWECLSQFIHLPLIDEDFYGEGIYDFSEELKWMGVTIDVCDGARFIALQLKLPRDPTIITADAAISLLHCIGYLASESLVLEVLVNKLKKGGWLRTSLGYRFPEECILLDLNWSYILKIEDGPFIDEKFYQNFASLGKDCLKAIGVKVNVEDACALLAKDHLLGENTSAIIRIYRFLDMFKWCPTEQDKSKSWLWIPPGYDNAHGKWVNPEACVLHNKDAALDLHLHVLSKHYDKELLIFFSTSFGVLEFPAVRDYIKLWKNWERGKNKLNSADCSAFWGYVIENWCLNVEETLKSNITKLPASTSSMTGVQLVDKDEVFIPDDVELKNIYLEASSKPLFVWCAQSSHPSLSQIELYKVYTSLGVRKISESVSSSGQSLPSSLEKVDSSKLICKGLIKIILGFLSGHCTTMRRNDRHSLVTSLLKLSVYESDEPITVNYSLLLPSARKRLDVETRRMVVWVKNCGQLLVRRLQHEDQKTNIVFVTCFARAISEGLLPHGSSDVIKELRKIIQFGFTFGFKEDAVDFLLTTENLELLAEDRSFLTAAFSTRASSRLSKRNLPCSPMTPSPKKQR